MRDGEAREEQRHDGHHRADQYTAKNPATDVAGDNEPVRQRRDQQLFDMLAELGAKERRDHIAVGVLNHSHHDQTRRDELHIVEAADLAHATTDQAAKNNEIQCRRDRRRHDSLAPDAHDAAEFTDNDSLESDPLRSRPRWGHAGELDADFFACSATAWSATTLAARALLSTRRIKSSSNRFTLLRMLVTATPCKDS